MLAPQTVHADDLRVGAAKIDITPPTGYPMWGYAVRKDQPSVGVIEPLMARAAVMAVNEQKLAIVSLDLGRAPSRAIMDVLRARVKKSAGVEQLFVVASHTHHGPVLELDRWPTAKEPYVALLGNKLAEVIEAANANLTPARLGIRTVETTLNRNRHSKRADRPVDRDLVVVRCEDRNGKTIAHLINFAAHPTMIDARDRRFSPDYAAAMAKVVEQDAGGLCLFLQGAAGDLSPNPDGKADPESFGTALGKKVLEVSKGLRCELESPKGLQMREREFRFEKRLDIENPFIRTLFSHVFFPELVDFYVKEYRDGIKPKLGVALLDGRIGIVGVSGEFFCGHALSLKRRARLEHVLFLGYCNDYHQYFPTIEAAAEGGYGADQQVSPIEVGAGERVMDRALIDLYEMRGKR